MTSTLTTPVDRTRELPWNEAVQRSPLRVLQINLGRYCNMACSHCHIEAGPKRREVIEADTVERIGDWLDRHRPSVLDLTGGAPELITGFRELVRRGRAAGCTVMDRCNLSALLEPGQEDLADFLAEHAVEVVASLPCYLQANVDRQRGRGAFDASIAGLQALNRVGYGRELPLYLVYNPIGPSLPPDQASLEPAYRQRLLDDWDIRFTQLWCLANVPVTRWRRHLQRKGRYDDYLALLSESFNEATLPGLMCRDTLSVDHRGRLYDCDFNLAIDLPLGGEAPRHLWDIVPEELPGRRVAMAEHCLACTAGSGSSCGGALT